MDHIENHIILHNMYKTHNSRKSKPETKDTMVTSKTNTTLNYLYFSFPRIK